MGESFFCSSKCPAKSHQRFLSSGDRLLRPVKCLPKPGKCFLSSAKYIFGRKPPSGRKKRPLCGKTNARQIRRFPSAFQLGRTNLQTAATAFGVRLTGVAGKKDSQTLLDTASTKAREDYAAFREIARAAFPAQADRIGLGLTGNVPQDLQKFITLAHTSYTNAKQDPWTTKMTTRNYAKARLDALNADLTALSGSESASNIAAGAAEEDTAARDNAYNALKEWIKEAHGVARGAFRKNAGALTKLNL